MERLTIFFEEGRNGGLNVKCRMSANEELSEHLLVPRGQPTELTYDSGMLTLKLKQGNVFLILDDGAAPLIFFVWGCSPHKTSEEDVVALYNRHSVPMPFSIDFSDGQPVLNRREWMII